MGMSKFIFLVLFKRKLQVLEKFIYNNGITVPKKRQEGSYHIEKTVKDP